MNLRFLKTRFFKTVVCLALVAMIFCGGVSFAFWNSYFAEGGSSIVFWVGSFEFSSQLPSFVPQNVADTLNNLQSQLPSQTLASLVEKVTNFFYNQPTASLKLAESADDLFSSGGLSGGDYLMYTIGSGESTEIVFIKIDSNASNLPTDANELNSMLAQSWTGINLISSVWNSGTLYTSFHAAVEHHGQLFFNQNDSRYISPAESAPGSWFLLTDDLSYSSFNSVYPMGHIAKTDNQFWIARTAAWNTAPSHSASWAWEEVNEWQASASFNQVVFTRFNGEILFWQALQNTAVEPTEASCRTGHWRQIKNAWIGRRGDMVTKNYYFAHNTYQNGDIVVFGVSPSLNLRYFEAVANVSVDQPPLIESANGTLVLNSAYWRAWQ